MPQFRAAWLLPISQPPIRDAWLHTDHGRIVAFGHSRPGDFTGSDEIDLGDAAVLPGLVNAHTHLELSWMRGRIPETDSFPDWIRSVIALRAQTDQQGEAVLGAVHDAIDESHRYGTALVGDISNTLCTLPALIDRNMAGLVFHELLGFRADAAERIVSRARSAMANAVVTESVRCTLSAHAPYSVSPAMFIAIQAAMRDDPAAPLSVHLGESAAEVEFLQEGRGPFRNLLDELGVWDSSWVVPHCGPLDYLERLGFLDERLLVVHGVQFGPAELSRIASSGATLVTCPRGNLRTGAGAPPIAEFFESGARVAVGTDSLASVVDLNMFAEIAEMRRLAPVIPARRLLESATATGARALGFAPDFGTIEPGKRDRLIAVELDGFPSNVEEDLVSGIDAAQIRWLPS
jgi:cytosine/adenosine deaminase-related metal-dependent hydrolase